MPELPHEPDGLLPTEALLDQLPLLLTHGITAMPRGSLVDGAAAFGRVLRHMRRHVPGSHARNEGSRIVTFVGSERPATFSLGKSVQHGQRCLTFGCARRAHDFGIDDQAVAVVHQDVRLISQLRSLPPAPRQASVWIRRRYVSVVAPLMAAEVHVRIAAVLRVTKTSNERSVEVTVVDRGPYGSRVRILDLSRAAAERLDYPEERHADVKVEVLSWGEGSRD